MKRFVLVLLAMTLLLAAGSALAVERYSKAMGPDTPAIPKFPSEEMSSRVLDGVPRPYSVHNELDEQIGDTLILGRNWRDGQHNCTFNPMMGIYADDEMAMGHFVWTHAAQASATPRYVRYTKVSNPFGEMSVDTYDGNTIGVAGAGYTTLDVDPMANVPYIYFHMLDTNGDYFSWIHRESDFVPNFFTGFNIEPIEGTVTIWPMGAHVANYDGNTYVHVISNGYEPATIENSLYYHRALYNPGTSTMENATPGGVNQVLVNEATYVLSSRITANDDGSRVCISQAHSRWLQGEGEDDWEGLAIAQHNNDIVYYESVDGGETWNWDDPVNVTEFIGPDPSQLPDTTAANGDTLRAYCEVDARYDAEDRLHVMFNAPSIDYYRTVVYRTARMFYWNDEHQLFTMVADGDFWNYAIAPTFEKSVCYGQTYKDDETGVLWAAWLQYGEPGDTTVVDDVTYPLDASDESFANADIYVAASPDNGLHWTNGINVTNTRTMDIMLEAGEGQSEMDPTLAMNCDGDYLHLFYTIDYDGGISEVGQRESGEPTLNDMVYQRISKSELMDIVTSEEDPIGWVRNYPLHIDSTGFYEDDSDWEWNGFWLDVAEGEELLPDQLELHQNYPNPFNPSTSIRFTLEAPGHVKLAVYDVLGREVAELVNRSLAAGSHSLTFMADDLPSGVYFYKLASGSSEQVRKMVLLK